MPEISTNAGDDASLEGKVINSAAPENKNTATPLTPHSAHPALRVCLCFSSLPDPLVQTYAQVLGVLGFSIVSKEGEAGVIVTNRSGTSQSHLRNGQHVVQLTRETKSSLYDAGSTNLKQHQEYGSRYHCADSAASILPLLSALSVVKRSLESSEAADPPSSLEFVKNLERSTISGKKIIALDNSSHNQAAARHQFGATNELTVLATYIDAISALKKNSYDIAVLDLLMPPESHLLGPDAFSRVVGSEFPAGLFIALLAARQGVREVYIVSDSSHHDHPATAIMGSVFSAPLVVDGGAMITFCPAYTVKGGVTGPAVKNWDASIKPYRGSL